MAIGTSLHNTAHLTTKVAHQHQAPEATNSTPYPLLIQMGGGHRILATQGKAALKAQRGCRANLRHPNSEPEKGDYLGVAERRT